MHRVILLVTFFSAFEQVYTLDGPVFAGCGVSNLTSTSGDKGPHPVVPGNFPWYTAIYERPEGNEHSWAIICSGTLITPRTVLTAADCVEFKPPDRIRVAMGKLRQRWNDSEPNEIKKSVVDIIEHNNYFGEFTMFKNNIALLVLDSDVPVSSFVCLVHNIENILNPLQTSAFVVGWDMEERVVARWGKIPEPRNELRYGRTSVLDHHVCVHTLNFGLLIPEDAYCNSTELVPHQFPNMGAGLTFQSDGRHYLYGIVSRNSIFSTGVQFVGLYTNISYHYEWIKDHMK